jgi:hypothetical protein
MKRFKYGLLASALLVLICIVRPLTLCAQEEKPLSKKVSLHADHERLEKVLNDLSEKGYFTFSYQSDLLQKDTLVTLTIKESTLRQALELILGNAYEYVESDDYVIIRRKEALAAKMAIPAKRVGGDVLVEPKYLAAKSYAAVAKPKLATIKRKQMLAKKAYVSDSLNTADSLNISELRQNVRDMIGDMVADGIIRDKESFKWFALDNGQFIVDGRRVADPLRAKYASKYIKADGNGYYCGTLAGVTGRGYFFSKEEIFGGKKE